MLPLPYAASRWLLHNWAVDAHEFPTKCSLPIRRPTWSVNAFCRNLIRTKHLPSRGKVDITKLVMLHDGNRRSYGLWG